VDWQEGLAILDKRGWDGDRVLDDVLNLVESPLFRRMMPPQFVAQAVQDVVDESEARALLAVAQAWLLKDDAVGDEVRRSVRGLRRS
jgi:hypothetical protein